jgi:hypothetical protein
LILTYSEERPSIDDVMQHEFFSPKLRPKFIPVEALLDIPVLTYPQQEDDEMENVRITSAMPERKRETVLMAHSSPRGIHSTSSRQVLVETMARNRLARSIGEVKPLSQEKVQTEIKSPRAQTRELKENSSPQSFSRHSISEYKERNDVSSSSRRSLYERQASSPSLSPRKSIQEMQHQKLSSPIATSRHSAPAIQQKYAENETLANKSPVVSKQSHQSAGTLETLYSTLRNALNYPEGDRSDVALKLEMLSVTSIILVDCSAQLETKQLHIQMDRLL